MPQYKVRSGQNIFDVALTLYGSVEGIFDLLASNDWLTMETELSLGMELKYHEEYMIDSDISLWLSNNDVVVKNGEHIYSPPDINNFIKDHFTTNHPALLDRLNRMSPDEQTMFWSSFQTPRLLIHQQGQLATIRLHLKPDTHLMIEWGDYTEPQIMEGGDMIELDHCYKGLGNHIITFYGDFDFYTLDLREVNGIHYPLNVINADKFESAIKIDELNKLIITDNEKR